MVEVVSQLKNLRMSHKKIRLVANTIKGLSVQEALARLRFIQRASAPIIAKLLHSAVANAQHNNNLSVDALIIKNVIVNQALPLKRWKPAAYGSAHPFKKHGSHIRLVLGLKSGVQQPEGRAKEAKKKSVTQQGESVGKKEDALKKILKRKETTEKSVMERTSGAGQERSMKVIGAKKGGDEKRKRIFKHKTPT